MKVDSLKGKIAKIREQMKELGRIEEELEIFRDRVRSPEAGEAFAAFVEKRKPVYKGK